MDNIIKNDYEIKFSDKWESIVFPSEKDNPIWIGKFIMTIGKIEDNYEAINQQTEKKVTSGD